MEIIDEDGNIATDKNLVYKDKWKNSFSNLYNSSVSQNVELICNNNDNNVPELNDNISTDEIYKAIFNQEK